MRVKERKANQLSLNKSVFVCVHGTESLSFVDLSLGFTSDVTRGILLPMPPDRVERVWMENAGWPTSLFGPRGLTLAVVQQRRRL